MSINSGQKQPAAIQKTFTSTRDDTKKGKLEYSTMTKPEVEKKTLEVYIRNDDYQSPPPAPRYRNNSFSDKYFSKNNLPNKYHINQNK